MRMVECDINDVIYSMNGRYRTVNFTLITEFLESGVDCVEIKEYTHVSAKGCVTALASTIKRCNMTGARAVMSRGKVYLVRADKIEMVKNRLKKKED